MLEKPLHMECRLTDKAVYPEVKLMCQQQQLRVLAVDGCGKEPYLTWCSTLPDGCQDQYDDCNGLSGATVLMVVFPEPSAERAIPFLLPSSGCFVMRSQSHLFLVQLLPL